MLVVFKKEFPEALAALSKLTDADIIVMEDERQNALSALNNVILGRGTSLAVEEAVKRMAQLTKLRQRKMDVYEPPLEHLTIGQLKSEQKRKQRFGF